MYVLLGERGMPLVVQGVQDVLKRGGLLYSFVGFGLLNNLLYVVILSAAIDLVGPVTPKGVVLLADVFPSFMFKISAPFYFHVVAYRYRIMLLVFLSFVGMQLVANSSELPFKLVGIAMASLSSGIGEVTFLQLTHYYNDTAVHAWSIGTGAAGLIGSFVYMAMTSWARVSARATLVVFSFMPFLVIVLYVYVLPPRQLRNAPDVPLSSSIYDDNTPEYDTAEETIDQRQPKTTKLKQLKILIVPFILPLMTVYVAEYVINQGISPTLLFDLLDMPMFRNYRDAYVMYSTLYQIGVFISRSSGKFVRIRNLWLLAILQTVNVLLAILQSLFMINPWIYLNFAFMLFEGLLGGASYINTFMTVSEVLPKHQREFALGAVTMSDSTGVLIAALISMWLEKALCGYQVRHNRMWCTI